MGRSRRGIAMAAALLASMAGGLGAEAGTDPGAPNPGLPRFGLLTTMEMGGLFVHGEGFEAVADAGYGRVSGDSVVALFSGGCFLRKPDIADLEFLFSYLAGGSFLWEDIFGIAESAFSLFGDSLAVQLELHPTFPFLGGIRPFGGAGYSLTNGLVDEVGDGFVAGRGFFLVGGLELTSLLGRQDLLLSDDGKGFFALRLSCYWRPAYAYGFRLDWDEFGAHYTGASPLPALRSFFGGSFPASSLAFGIGISIGYSPWELR